jgi:general secretion pathway protein A
VLAQKGLCLRAIGRYDDAVGTIRTALDHPHVTQAEKVPLQYLLARTYEVRGEFDEAKELYTELDRGPRKYRDVSARLARLNQARKDRHEDDTERTIFEAFWRGFGRLLRGTG